MIAVGPIAVVGVATADFAAEVGSWQVVRSGIGLFFKINVLAAIPCTHQVFEWGRGPSPPGTIGLTTICDLKYTAYISQV